MKNKDHELIYRLDKRWQPQSIDIKGAGGQTNKNYIVQYQNKKFFVRLPWQKAGIIDRKTEAENILVLARCEKLCRILPKYHIYIFGQKNILLPESNQNFDLPNGAMLAEYIEGKDIDGWDLASPKTQKSLLKSLNLFHASGVKFTNPYDVFQDEILKYRVKAKEYPIYELISENRIKKIEFIEVELKNGLSLGGEVSTHNDLIFENLRLGKDNRVYLLDFEYAGFNVRDGFYYDIGIILGGNLFQKNPIKIEDYNKILAMAEKIYQKKIDFRKAYCGALTNILVMFWWGLIKYFSSESADEKKYFKNYVFARSKGIDFLLGALKIQK